MSQAALIGTYENICIYRLVGFKTIEVSNAVEAQEAVDLLTKEDTAVIFIEEDMLGDKLRNYKINIPLIPIPFAKKENNSSLIKLKLKTLGSDMIFGKD